MTWETIINTEFQKEYMKSLAGLLEERRQKVIVYPSPNNVFRAYKLTPFNKVKVVILGQDPYHDGNADGLAFSCKKRLTPSMRAIAAALNIHTDRPITLEKWAEQGVLLLNTCLTIDIGTPLSHKGRGWEDFVSVTLEELMKSGQPLVFLLWGKVANDTYDNLRIKVREHKDIRTFLAEHPVNASRNNRNWEHKNCFLSTNEFLISRNLTPINWHVIRPVEDEVVKAKVNLETQVGK